MPGRQRVISGLLTPSGTSQKAIEQAFDQYVVVSSADAMLELEEKLSTRKFQAILAAADIETFLERLVQRVEFFVPTVFQSRSRDPKDDKFLDLAQTVGAAFLITGDKDLLSLATSHGVPGLQIVQPAEFLRRSSE